MTSDKYKVYFFNTKSACVADFWMSDLNQQGKNQDLVLDQNHSRFYLHVNPVIVDESSKKDLSPSFISKPDAITSQTITPFQQNGDTPQEVSPEVKGLTNTTSKQEIKYKRPPPRPPSMGPLCGVGLLFSSPPSPHTLSSVTIAAKRKEETSGGVGEREERKSMTTSPPPSRPPVPLQSRATPPLPPAPLRGTSFRKSTNTDVGEGRDREEGQNPAKKTEQEGGVETEENTVSNSGLMSEGGEQENSNQHQEEVKRDSKKTEKEQEKEVKMDKGDDRQQSSSQCPTSVKKPSRPVPPPRRKPHSTGTPVCPNQAGGEIANQCAGMRVPPPHPMQRSDVSLYSPQGGTVIGADPDSCSTSSTEEEGEPNQDRERNQK